MLGFLPAPVLGCIVATLLISNTLLWAAIILLFSPLKLISWLLPATSRLIRPCFSVFQESWTGVNRWIYRLLPDLTWDVRGLHSLDRKQWFFVISNHQCWVDILATFQVLNRRVPPMKIFIKQELLYVPLVGLAVYALDYPFMKRYSREFIAKHPHLRGKDLETTRKACAKYQHYPVSVMSYLEGTRITPQKHADSGAIYQYLLPPKSAGAAFVLNALGSRMQTLLDMTIAYPGGIPSFWDFCSGRVRRIMIDIRLLDIPPHFIEKNFEHDPAFREEFKGWIESIWRDKDARIHHLLNAA